MAQIIEVHNIQRIELLSKLQHWLEMLDSIQQIELKEMFENKTECLKIKQMVQLIETHNIQCIELLSKLLLRELGAPEEVVDILEKLSTTFIDKLTNNKQEGI